MTREAALMYLAGALGMATLIAFAAWVRFFAPCWFFAGADITKVPYRCLEEAARR